MAGNYSRVEADLCRAMSALPPISSASPPGADFPDGAAESPLVTDTVDKLFSRAGRVTMIRLAAFARNNDLDAQDF